MKCKEIELLLAEYYENSLDPDERKRVEQHLTECESCRLKQKEIEQTYQLLEKESVSQPEESFWTNFLPQVRSRIEAEEKPRLTLFPKPRLAFALISAVVVVALSFFLFTPDKKNLEKLRTESMVETTLPESDLSSYADQLAEILSSQEDQSLPLETFLSSGGRGDMELTEKILDEDYLSQRNLNSILNELSLEELKRLEESIKTLQIGDIL
ncbi:MAG: hypothetical protein AMJ91_00510 [candidate division Zixibacteria bacterium SM23_73_3]|nr:MAG: hypothetical protein AMJ91_00510 [candidate division Zixibacteria bacterium SM23_73_3]